MHTSALLTLVSLAALAMLVVPPAAAGDCLDLPADHGVACYGDNHIAAGDCDTEGFSVDYTGVLVDTPHGFLFVGGFNGCTTEGERSDFTGTGFQADAYGVASASARYDYESSPEWPQAWCAYTWHVGTPVYGVGGGTDCVLGPHPPIPWGHLEP